MLRLPRSMFAQADTLITAEEFGGVSIVGVVDYFNDVRCRRQRPYTQASRIVTPIKATSGVRRTVDFSRLFVVHRLLPGIPHHPTAIADQIRICRSPTPAGYTTPPHNSSRKSDQIRTEFVVHRLLPGIPHHPTVVANQIRSDRGWLLPVSGFR